MADHRGGGARGDREIDIVEDAPVAVVAEADMAEAYFGTAHGQRPGIGRVRDLAVGAEQHEHPVHVGGGLLDLAIDHAQEIERDIQLDHQRVDQHQVAQRQHALRHADGGAPQDQDQADRDDRLLAEVQQRQRVLRADRGGPVGAQVLVVARGLVGLVAEVLDGLEVQQRVDRLLVGTRIQLVHLAAEVRAPFGHHHREDDIGEQRAAGDRGEPDVVVQQEEAHHQRHLDQRRQDAVQRIRDQRLDAARAPFDVAAHAAGLAVQMKAQRQAVQMAEHLQRNLAHRALRDLGEQDLAQFGKQRGRQPQQAVGDDQPGRHCQQRARIAWGDVHRIDQPLHQHRHAEVGRLGGHQAGERQHHAPLVMPQIGKQIAHGLPVAALAARAGEQRRRRGRGGRLVRRGIASHTLEFGPICDCRRVRPGGFLPRFALPCAPPRR